MRSHTETLRLKKFSLRLKKRQLLLQFLLDAMNGFTKTIIASDVVSCREDDYFTQFLQSFTCKNVNHGDAINRISEHLNAKNILFIRRVNLDGVATDAEVSAAQSHVITVILEINHSAKNAALVVVNPNMKFE